MTLPIRVLVLSLCCAALPSVAQAQVVFDSTFTTEGTAPTRLLDGRTDYLIEQDRGLRIEANGRANLFHSFSGFDLASTDSATFTATDPVDLILARITGGTRSTIAGRLRSEVPGADLFFVNPSGVTFTETAELELPGSLFITSADFVGFEDGTSFSSTAAVPTVTAASPTAFGFMGGAAGDLVFQGDGQLDGADGQTLGLIGGNVDIADGMEIYAVGGRIEIGAVGTEAVDVPVDLASWSPRADGLTNLGEVRITGLDSVVSTLDFLDFDSDQGRIVIRGGAFRIENSFLRAAGDGTGGAAIDIETTDSVTVVQSEVKTFGAGNSAIDGIRVDSSQVLVSGSARAGIAVETFGAGDAGPIEIMADRVSLVDGGQIQSDTSGAGSGASIVIVAGEVDLDAGSQIQTDTSGPGVGGSITIDSGSVVATNLSAISSRTAGLGAVGNDAGPILIETDVLEMRSGSRISGTTDGSGRGADIDIDAEDRIVLDGEFNHPTLGTLPSGIFARSGTSAGSPATGAGGVITLGAGDMVISNGAQIAASPRGTGNAGGIYITVDRTFSIAGRGGLNSGIFAEGVEGDGGDITVEAETIELLDGARIESAALADGAAGNITLIAESIVLQDDVQVNARSEGAGAAGDVLLDGGTVQLMRGARVQSTAESTANAGNITIEGDSIHVSEGASVLTIARQSAGGTIRLDTSGTLAIDGASRVATDVQGMTGQGGDVIIVSDSTVVNGAEVTANAFSANAQAGNIFIQVQGGYLEATGPDTTVEATNRFGIDGLKVVNAPINQVVGDLVALESDFIDASSQLEEACAARDSASGSFSVQRGRAPPAPPDQLLESDAPRHLDLLADGVGRCEDAR